MWFLVLVVVVGTRCHNKFLVGKLCKAEIWHGNLEDVGDGNGNGSFVLPGHSRKLRGTCLTLPYEQQKERCSRVDRLLFRICSMVSSCFTVAEHSITACRESPSCASETHRGAPRLHPRVEVMHRRRKSHTLSQSRGWHWPAVVQTDTPCDVTGIAPPDHRLLQP
ncbi:hypothetical protein EDB82DRAFT_489262 [Fusarium venenatum]|uniref:uncharacterized protein n=1 Tax=Fusarium venenatum TaxID=56646 RepID=UPI001DF89048|nr:hypothetical protein EDB82DRAFT_489262 [Fusarium venenatum]